MGWTFTHRDRGMSHREFFSREFPSVDILDCATVDGVFYAAAKSRKRGDVFALVCLIRWVPKDRYNFGYKDMDETVGPYAARCPERILRQLTPLEPGRYPNAEDWRARARSIAAKKTPKVGDIIRLEEPVYFGGVPESILTKISVPGRRDVYQTPTGRRLHLPRLKDYRYSFIEEVRA